MSKEFGSMPLTWTKLGEYNDKADLYLCDQIVAHMRFDPRSNEWNGSELQRWLNCEFYRQAFSDEQRKQIVGNEKTQDCVFLLSVEEFEKYKQRISGTHHYWWLRSPGSYTKYSKYSAFVNYKGDILNEGPGVIHYYGVRPAILLRNV